MPESAERADALWERCRVRRVAGLRSGLRPLSRRRFRRWVRELEAAGYRVVDSWDLARLLERGPNDQLRERYGDEWLRRLRPRLIESAERAPHRPSRRLETDEEVADRRARAAAFESALRRHGLDSEYHAVTDLILDAGHGAPMLSEPLHSGSLRDLYEDIVALYRAHVEELDGPYADAWRARRAEVEQLRASRDRWRAFARQLAAARRRLRDQRAELLPWACEMAEARSWSEEGERLAEPAGRAGYRDETREATGLAQRIRAGEFGESPRRPPGP